MIPSISRREILGCSGGVAMGLAIGGAAGYQLTKRAAGSGRADDELTKPELVRLLFNENPYGPPESAKRALHSAVSGSWMYGHQDVSLLREMIAEHEGLRPNNVIITEGSCELLKIAGLVFGAGKEVVCAYPTFTMLPDYAVRNGGKVEAVALNSDLGIDLFAMEERVNDRTGVVYVCNPNNPTGANLNSDDLRGFINIVSPRVAVIVDEAYIDFTEKPDLNSMVDRIRAGMNVVVSRTFSKAYGMAGLRIGYGLGRSDVIDRLEQRRVSNPNRLGVIAALASYKDEKFLSYSRKMIRAGIDRTYSFLNDIGLRYIPTQGNFILFDSGRPSIEFYRHMRSHNILIAPRTNYLETWVRVSIGRLEDMDLFAQVARQFFLKT